MLLNIPTIAVCNQATIPLGVDLTDLMVASQIYLVSALVPAWGTRANLIHTEKPSSTAWNMVFLDNADQANALGYHDVAANGLPFTKVFVKDTIDSGGLVSVTFTHELAEMLVDPICQKLMLDNSTGDVYPLEVADAVEESVFTVGHKNIPVSNFVLPTWFEFFHAPKSVKFDWMGHLTEPFQLEAGGYAEIIQGGKWNSVFGTREKAKRFATEDRRDHRTQIRRAALNHLVKNDGEPVKLPGRVLIGQKKADRK